MPVVAYCICRKQSRAESPLTRLARQRVLPQTTKTEAAAFLADQRGPMVPMVLSRMKGPVLSVESFGASGARQLRFFTAPTIQRRLLPALDELDQILPEEHLRSVVLRARGAGVGACVSGVISQTAAFFAHHQSAFVSVAVKFRLRPTFISIPSLALAAVHVAGNLS